MAGQGRRTVAAPLKQGEIDFRPATPEDLRLAPSYARLTNILIKENAFVGISSPQHVAEAKEEMEEILSLQKKHRAALFLAVAGEQIAGRALMRRGEYRGMDHVVFLERVATHPEFRRRRVARTLLASCIDQARRWGAHLIVVEVIGSGEAAARLYAGAGFALAGRIPGLVEIAGDRLCVSYHYLEIP